MYFVQESQNFFCRRSSFRYSTSVTLRSTNQNCSFLVERWQLWRFWENGGTELGFFWTVIIWFISSVHSCLLGLRCCTFHWNPVTYLPKLLLIHDHCNRKYDTTNWFSFQPGLILQMRTKEITSVQFPLKAEQSQGYKNRIKPTENIIYIQSACLWLRISLKNKY